MNSVSEISENDEYAIVYWVNGSVFDYEYGCKKCRKEICDILGTSGAMCVTWNMECLIITTKYKNIENMMHMFWLVRMGYYGKRFSEFFDGRKLNFRPQILRRFTETDLCENCWCNK